MTQIKKYLLLCASLWPILSHATTYCPTQGGYIKIGMTKSQVLRACGKPESVQKTKESDTRNVKVTQLIYGFSSTDTTRGYAIISTGPKDLSLTVTIQAKKVSSISLNGQSTQGASICRNGAFKVGSPVSTVINACGQPSYTNQSFKTIAASSNLVEKEIWTIHTSPYSPKLTLTFKNGILESIQ